MDYLLTVDGILALLALITLEIVLGIDNIVFLAILTNKLPSEDRPRARYLGLSIALIMRLLLLFTISWMATLTQDLFVLFGQGFSGRDLVLLGGGIFLIWKATKEVHESLELPIDPDKEDAIKTSSRYWAVITQIVIVDLVFSLDSVITAVGLTQHFIIMVISIVFAIIAMMIFAGFISKFIEKHPTIKMLALSFLLLVGTFLIADAFDVHINRNFLYFAMAFSMIVEGLNIRLRKVIEIKSTKRSSKNEQ